MQIQIISTSVETKPTAKGSYQVLEVVFKNLTYQGKVESKKLMSFGANASAFKALQAAQAGSAFEVTVTKNDKGYNDWTAVGPVTGDAAAPAAAAAKGSSPAPRSTYETPEERAQRQILIVRQSSVSSALNLHSVGAKSQLKLEDVLSTAQKICDFVFEVRDQSTTASGFEDIPDFDIPHVE